MAKLIIETYGIEESLALIYVSKVITQGLISKDNTQYCYATVFDSGVEVSANKTKNGTHTFKVMKGNHEHNPQTKD